MTILLVILAIVVVLVLGWAIVGFALQLLWWALIGLVIGALARLVLPGRQPIGWLATAGIGVAAAILGGVIADAVGLGSVLEFVLAVALAVAGVALFARRRRAFA